MIGRRLDRYLVKEKLGEGAMGEVYRAHDEHLNRDIAIKVLRPGSVADESARKRFRKEAEALSRLSHPYIATIHDFASEDGADFIVMELVTGPNLAKKVKAGPLPEQDVTRLGLQIAEALEEAHERGIIHRDLKPANIALTGKGHAKVLDFGIARLARSEKEMADAATVDILTKTLDGAGTFPYMAPEQLHGKPADARTDIWSLGVVLYEMVTARRPFTGKNGPELVAAILQQAPPALATIDPSISTELERVILKCLEKDPTNRYQTAGEIVAALRFISGTATDPADAKGQALQSLGWPGRALLLLGILALASITYWVIFPPEAGAINSIAVLPLVNLMNDPEQDYFVEGMHEGIITELSKIGALTVTSHTSTHKVDPQHTLPQVADTLGVRALVEGSILRDGNQVQITVQLIDGETDKHIWSDTFDGELGNIISLINNIARRIAGEIHIALTPQEETRLAATQRVNPQAYEEYLRGHYHLQQQLKGIEALNKALASFRRAIDLDPAFAAAYAGLANAYSDLALFGGLPYKQSRTLALEAASKAIELDDSNAEAHGALAHVMVYDWDWENAEREFRRALDQEPNSTVLLSNYAFYLGVVGRGEEAIVVQERLTGLDPLSATHAQTLGWHYFYAGKYDESITQMKKLGREYPDDSSAHAFIAMSYVMQGMPEKAAAECDLVFEKWPKGFVAVCTWVYARTGRRARVLEILGNESDISIVGPSTDPFYPAWIYDGLGETERAIEEIEKAWEMRSTGLIFLKVEPLSDELRADPRFQKIYRQMNFPE